MLFIFVFEFLLESAEIVGEYLKENVQDCGDFCVVRRGVGRQVDLLAAQGLVDLGHLIGVVVDVSHGIFVELELVRLPLYLLKHAAFISEEASEELSQYIDTGKYISVMSVHDILFIGAFEGA